MTIINHSKIKNNEMLQKTSTLSNKIFLIIVLFYFISLLIIFNSVIMKPMNSPDSISQAYPIYQFNKTYFSKHFTLPFWFPYMNGGIPYLEGMHFNHLFDFPIYLFPIDLGIGYRAMLFVLMAGLFAFLFFKSLGFSNLISLLAGLAYMLSGNAISYTSLGHYGKVVNMAFLPLALMFINYAFSKRKYITFLFTGLAIGLMAKGHPQIFYYNLIIISVIYLFKFIFEWREKKDNTIIKFAILGYALMGISAILVSFDNLYHQLQFVKLTSRGGAMDINPAERWAFATSWSEHPLELLTYFIPGIWGLQNQTYMGWKPFVSTTDYVGLIVFVVALFGIIKNWKDKYTKLFFLITLFATLYGFGKFFEPYFRIFYNYVPMMKSFRVPASIYIPITFFWIYFFAYGIKSIINGDIIKKEDKKFIIYFIIAIFILAIILTGFINSELYKNILKENLGLKLNMKMLYEKYPAYQVEQYITQILTPTIKLVKEGLTYFWIFNIIGAILILLMAHKKIKVKTFIFLLSITIFIDLYRVNKNFVLPADNYDMVSKETDVIKFLKTDTSKFRIIPFPPEIDNESNKWCNFGIESAFGYNPVTLKIYDDVLKAGLLYNLKFLGLLNVKYLLTKQLYNDPNIEEIHRGSQIVYKNKLFLPRIFFIHQYKIIKESKDILTYLRSQDFKPNQEVVIEEDIDVIKNIKIDNVKDNMISIIQYDLDKIQLNVEVNKPGFLFLSEVYYPKWECYVNGEKKKIFKSNYLFRSIFLENGKYDILFIYKNNKIYIITVLFSLLSTLLILYLLIKFIKMNFFNNKSES